MLFIELVVDDGLLVFLLDGRARRDMTKDVWSEYATLMYACDGCWLCIGVFGELDGMDVDWLCLDSLVYYAKVIPVQVLDRLG